MTLPTLRKRLTGGFSRQPRTCVECTGSRYSYIYEEKISEAIKIPLRD